MLKLIGRLGLVIACGLSGIMKTGDLKKRVALLEDYLQMIIELKGQINYFREPLPDIFDKLKKNDRSAAYIILDSLGTQLREKGGEIVKIWPEKVEEIYKSEPVTADDMEIMKYPGEFIGQTDFENHIYHFTYLEEKLKKQIIEAQESYKKKGPMYSKIGFFLGSIGAIILF